MRHRHSWAAILLGLVLALAGCEAEVDHLFNADGSSTFQIGLGSVIDEAEGESIDCDRDSADAPDGYEVQFVTLEQRGEQTWCLQGTRMDSPRHLIAYYETLNEEQEILRVHCLDIVDGKLFYDVDIFLDPAAALDPEDRLTWRVTAPHAIESTNADTQAGDTAIWDLTSRSGWVSMRAMPFERECPTAGFLLNIMATTESSGTALIELGTLGPRIADTEAFMDQLAAVGWNVEVAQGQISASQTWDDAAGLAAIGRALPMAPGSDFVLVADSPTETTFEARLDLSFYESFWQGINPALEDPSFRFVWTPLPGPLAVAGDWTEPGTRTFDWTVDTAGRIFSMSTSTEGGQAPSAADLAEDDEADEPGFGVVERDGQLFITSRPGEVLSLNRSDLPIWAAYEIATQGAVIAVVGPPDTIASGDSSILIDGAPIARLDDRTTHGGRIVSASDRIFANGVPVAVLLSQAVDPMVTGTVPHVGGPIITTGAVQDGDLERRQANIETAVQQEVDAFLRDIKQLTSDAQAGDARLEVDSDGVAVGDVVAIGSDPNQLELGRVAAKGSIILEQPLLYDHDAGTFIQILAPDVLEGGTSSDEGSVPIVALLAAVVGVIIVGALTALKLSRRSDPATR